MKNLEENISIINERISSAKSKAGRNDEVKLIAVSKTKPAELIREAYELGLKDFGENKVQEALTKTSISANDINWHLIGHLQSNKAKEAISFASLIHSVDSLKLASELQKQCAKVNKIQDILIQVNTSAEESKSGIEPEKALELIKNISGLSNIRIKGLMTIGKLTDNKYEIRECFKLLKDIYEQCKNIPLPNVEMKYLSMGMSDDFEIAIEEGSNMVRVGSALFGNRSL